MTSATIHDAYDSLAKAFPDRLAAIDTRSGGSISYDELRSRSMKLALYLQSRNVSDCTIGSITTRNIDTLVTLLAVSRLSNVSWVPLTSSVEASAAGMPQEKWISQIQYCITEAELKFLLTDPDADITSIDPLITDGVTVITLSFQVTTEQKPIQFPSSRKFPILKLLSGGTTGVPKLYPISHEMMLSELDNYPHVIGSSNFSALLGKPVLQQSCLLWPASCLGQFNIALACQGTAVITHTRDSVKLAAEIDQFNVRIVGGVPSQLSLLVEYLESKSFLTIFSWGEPIVEQTVTRLLAKPAVAVIELLVATEYWLCMYRRWDKNSEISLSREFSVVPSCHVELIEPDSHNVGQLSLTGPMVSNTTIVTNDLVRKTSFGIEFVGRVDFVTKIGGNWFDFRQVENLVMSLELYPPVQECVAITVNKIHYLLISVDTANINQCVYIEWISRINECVRSVCPVDLTIRIITTPLPRTLTSGKINRKKLISTIGEIAKREKPHVAEEIGKVRFLKELKSHAKWTAVFAIALRQYALIAPYMYLVLLHCPRNFSGYLPRSRKQSPIVSLFARMYEFVSRSFPFGKFGFLVSMTLLASRKKNVRKIIYLWTLAGIALAIRGKRALSWPVAFWVSIGGETRSECEPWLKESKWKYFFKDWKFNILSICDAFTDTQLCEEETSSSSMSQKSSISPPEIVGEKSERIVSPEIAGDDHIDPQSSVPTSRGNSIDGDDHDDHGERERVDVRDSNSPPISQDALINEWWTKSPVEYIGVHDIEVEEPSSVLSPPSRSPPRLAEGSGCGEDSIPEFIIDCVARVVGPHLKPVTRETILLSLSSLQVTELVQRIRVRIPIVSARDIMESPSCGDLIIRLTDDNLKIDISRNEEKNINDSNQFRIQFSPGQIGRVCRWMIKSRDGFDREKLGNALNLFVARHPLLRAEIVEPKPFLSFMYDGGVMVMNARRFFASPHPAAPMIMPWLDLITDCVYDSWLRTVVHPPDALPSHWDPVLSKWSVTVNDYEDFRRKIMAHKRELEDSWYLRQIPINARIYTLNNCEYLLLSIKHSLSDGNSAFPLIDDLAKLYHEDSSVLDMVPKNPDPLPELEKRFRDGLYQVIANPNRLSLRTNLFYSEEVEKIGGGYYRHYLCFEASMITVMRRLASDSFHIGFDSLLLSLLVMSLLVTDDIDTETITLYSPLRDGPGESSFIGLFSDWRDMTVQTFPSASLVDVINDIAYRVRTRDWVPTVSPANPESLLLNWLAFDTTRRYKVWEPFHLDNITTKWNKMDTRDYDPYATPSGRFRSMSLEQYDRNGQWWLRFDVATAKYPPEWMMRYTRNVNQIFNDMVNCPLKPLRQ